MPIKRHRWIAIVALALLGTALGAPSGYWLGRATLLRTARNGLANYASELAGRGDEYAAELRVIRNAFNPSPFPFCSHEEISRMQALTFRSLQVKEVGRIHNGLLYCSAFLGRLDKPHDMPPLTMTLRNGTQIYTNAHLMIAAMAQGTIIANSDVDVILNPNAFDYWSRPHVHFMVVTFNRATTHGLPEMRLTWILPRFLLKETKKPMESSTAPVARNTATSASSQRNPPATSFPAAVRCCWNTQG
jgi:sensor c-di-GMP phosphodiesterase-like protein